MVVCLTEEGPPVSFIYTEAQRFDASAALRGSERFPEGAMLRVVTEGRRRALVPGFAASADAAVSFDGRRVLFAGRQKSNTPWQIWEVEASGGTPRRVITTKEDAIAPFYLPGERIVYSRRGPRGFALFTAAMDGGAQLQLTYEPGSHVVCDVLRDGRILFAAPHPAGATMTTDLYTVYTDGSGVETYRCDHGVNRRAGRELASGDILFETAGRLAAFTSARATDVDLTAPPGDFAGPAAELSPEEWLLSWRPRPPGRHELYRWKLGTNTLVKVAAAGPGGYQPTLLRAHAVPKRHPSGLGDRDGANLLCLSVYTSKLDIPEGSVRAVRVWGLDTNGVAVPMGQAPVERDGSFFVNPPSETPIRFELLDGSGRSVVEETGWFWARRGEQRICVGCHAGPERSPENATPAILRRSTEPVKLRLPVHGGTK